MSPPPATTRVGSVVAGLCLVQFVDVLGVTVVVTALPDMLADVGGAPADGSLVRDVLRRPAHVRRPPG
ncbi:hypothetical protein [Blastococcus litoris]|uniref:hypothetical protein n=1 Tax=Blastococcus litoris TaxID=2171622 RepID=UPI0013DED2B6|nr:hypothetical protein [Blastococcus litoris]